MTCTFTDFARLAGAATPGPWYRRLADDEDYSSATYLTRHRGAGNRDMEGWEWDRAEDIAAITLLQYPNLCGAWQKDENTSFILASRSLGPELCAELERAVEDRARLIGELERRLRETTSSRRCPAASSEAAITQEAPASGVGFAPPTIERTTRHSDIGMRVWITGLRKLAAPATPRPWFPRRTRKGVNPEVLFVTTSAGDGEPLVEGTWIPDPVIASSGPPEGLLRFDPIPGWRPDSVIALTYLSQLRDLSETRFVTPPEAAANALFIAAARLEIPRLCDAVECALQDIDRLTGAILDLNLRRPTTASDDDDEDEDDGRLCAARDRARALLAEFDRHGARR